jgi:hemoglobin
MLGGVAAGCSAPAGPSASEPTLYERLGGRVAISAVVDDAIANLAADPRINGRFGHANATQLKDSLVDLLCQRTGGPCAYTGRNMADAHEGMHIRDDEFDDLLEDIAKSFAKFNVRDADQQAALGLLRQMRHAVVGH